MSIILAAPPASEPRTCPAWCAQHEVDVCLGAIVTIDVTADPGWSPIMASALSVGLNQCPEDGLTVDLSIDYRGPNEVPVSAARQYALAILAQCERVEAPLIPGPRASIDTGLGSTWSDPAVRRAVRETIAESEADR